MNWTHWNTHPIQFNWNWVDLQQISLFAYSARIHPGWLLAGAAVLVATASVTPTTLAFDHLHRPHFGHLNRLDFVVAHFVQRMSSIQRLIFGRHCIHYCFPFSFVCVCMITLFTRTSTHTHQHQLSHCTSTIDFWFFFFVFSFIIFVGCQDSEVLRLCRSMCCLYTAWLLLWPTALWCLSFNALVKISNTIAVWCASVRVCDNFLFGVSIKCQCWNRWLIKIDSVYLIESDTEKIECH